MARHEHPPVELPGVPTAVLLAWGAAPTTTKGPKPRWTLDQIRDVGVRLGDEQGVEAITMSGVAKALGSGTMSLYRYVESREDLLILAADRALQPGRLNDDGTPRSRLHAWVSDLRQAYERHPWLTAVPVGTEPLLPSYVHRLEAGMACLEPLGVSGNRAVTVLTMLWTYTRADVEQTAHLATSSGDLPTDGTNRLFADRLRALSGEHGVSRVLAVLEDDSASDSNEFTAAIDLVIDGLKAPE